MTLDKALEILRGSVERNIPYPRIKMEEAQKLGMEGLERLVWERRYKALNTTELPSETES